MKILPHLDSEKIMLINTMYHYGRKETDYNDYLDIIYKDIETGEKFVETIENPEMDIYFAKDEYKISGYYPYFIERDKAVKHRCAYKDVLKYIAEEAGGNYKNYYYDCIKTKNRGKLKNLHKYPNVAGSDYNIENWYRIQWLLNNHNDKPKHITKMYLDIETDIIDIKGIPKGGNCPINAVTIVDQEDMISYTLFLRDETNPLIQEFEDTIEEFIEECHNDFDETYGRLEYKFFGYDDERDLITDIFKLINTLKRDFVLIWHIDFDIPFIIDRIKVLGMDPVEVMCHKDFRIKEYSYTKDTRNFDIKNKTDVFKLSSYSVFMCQMENYGGLRKGQQEIPSFALTKVAEAEIGDSKLDYSETSDLKNLPRMDFKKFIKYNIKDVLLQMGIDMKTEDTDSIYQRAYSNATVYDKVFRQTVFLKNRAYIEYYKQGLIIGNNINLNYGVDYNEEENSDDEEEDKKFDGAVVADPALNSHNGLKLYGAERSKNIFDYVVDMDFSSMYPFIKITFNIAPNCLIGKLIIDDTVTNIALTYSNENEILEKDEDLGKEFIDNYLIDDVATMGQKWFNLPSFEDMVEDFEKEFSIKEKETIIIHAEDLKYLPMGMKIEV